MIGAFVSPVVRSISLLAASFKWPSLGTSPGRRESAETALHTSDPSSLVVATRSHCQQGAKVSDTHETHVFPFLPQERVFAG